jgi:predicted transcriptional regulator
MPKRSRKSPPKAATPFQFLVALPKETVDRLDEIAFETSVPRVSLVRSAIETFLAERGEEKISVELSDELRCDLMALRDAMDGASVQLMIERSLRRHIDDTVQRNSGIAESYEKLRARHTSSAKVVQFRRARSRTK